MNRLARFLRLAVIFPMPAGIVADKASAFGLQGLINNVNNYSEALTPAINSTGGITLTGAQISAGIINVTVSGVANLQLPAANVILGVLGQTIPIDGSYAEPFKVMNNGTGATLTLTASADGTVTVTGTATVANNTIRDFLLTVNAGGTTISVQNLGTKAL